MPASNESSATPSPHAVVNVLLRLKLSMNVLDGIAETRCKRLPSCSQIEPAATLAMMDFPPIDLPPCEYFDLCSNPAANVS